VISPFLHYVCVSVLLLYMGGALLYVFLYGVALGPDRSKIWLYILALAVLQDILVIKPGVIWMKFVVMSSFVGDDVNDVTNLVRDRVKFVLNRRKGVLGNTSTLLQHLNPACRVARKYPHLYTSRLLMALNDFDLPNPAPKSKKISLVSRIVIVIGALFSALIIGLTLLPDFMQEVMVVIVMIIGTELGLLAVYLSFVSNEALPFVLIFIVFSLFFVREYFYYGRCRCRCRNKIINDQDNRSGTPKSERNSLKSDTVRAMRTSRGDDSGAAEMGMNNDNNAGLGEVTNLMLDSIRQMSIMHKKCQQTNQSPSDLAFTDNNSSWQGDYDKQRAAMRSSKGEVLFKRSIIASKINDILVSSSDIESQFKPEHDARDNNETSDARMDWTLISMSNSHMNTDDHNDMHKDEKLPVNNICFIQNEEPKKHQNNSLTRNSLTMNSEREDTVHSSICDYKAVSDLERKKSDIDGETGLRDESERRKEEIVSAPEIVSSALFGPQSPKIKGEKKKQQEREEIVPEKSQITSLKHKTDSITQRMQSKISTAMKDSNASTISPADLIEKEKEKERTVSIDDKLSVSDSNNELITALSGHRKRIPKRQSLDILSSDTKQGRSKTKQNSIIDIRALNIQRGDDDENKRDEKERDVRRDSAAKRRVGPMISPIARVSVEGDNLQTCELDEAKQEKDMNDRKASISLSNKRDNSMRGSMGNKIFNIINDLNTPNNVRRDASNIDKMLTKTSDNDRSSVIVSSLLVSGSPAPSPPEEGYGPPLLPTLESTITSSTPTVLPDAHSIDVNHDGIVEHILPHITRHTTKAPKMKPIRAWDDIDR